MLKILEIIKNNILYVILAIFLLFVWVFRKKTDNNVAVYDDVNSSPTTLTDLQANSISGVLLSAMDRYGTDEKEIVDVLKDLSYNDIVKVYDSFGVKSYDALLGVQGGSLIGEDYDLIQWLTAELSKEDLDKIKHLKN